jgi:hypothetical protein
MAVELHNIDPEDIEDWLMEVEKSFNFTFEQDELMAVQTFGDLSDHVISKLTLVQVNDCTTQQAFYKLRLAIEEVLQVDSITPRTLLVDILPRKRRISTVKRLEGALGFKLWLLAPPAFVEIGLLILLFVSLLSFVFSVKMGICGLLLSSSGFWIAAKYGKELTVQTVDESVERAARINYIQSRRDASTCNRTEIERLLADWLRENFCLSKTKLIRESKFTWAMSAKR